MNERLEKKISKWEGVIETISFYSDEEEKLIDYIEEFVDDLKEMVVLDKPEITLDEAFSYLLHYGDGFHYIENLVKEYEEVTV